jgi:hypothetical protein
VSIAAGCTPLCAQSLLRPRLLPCSSLGPLCRAQPLLPAVLRQLCPREPTPGPEAWLTVLPTMLNTCVVLLCDHGTAASGGWGGGLEG